MKGLNLTDAAIRRIADNKIREAMDKGAFDHLPGTGKPISSLGKSIDDNWWIRQWLKREQLADEANRKSLSNKNL